MTNVEDVIIHNHAKFPDQNPFLLWHVKLGNNEEKEKDKLSAGN